MKQLLILWTALIAGGGIASAQEWATFSDTNRHFHFQYPPSWKVNTQTFPIMHYREVFVSLNSFGDPHFRLREEQTSTNTWQFGARAVTNQLPIGATCLDIGWWEGPWPRFGPGIQESDAADLSALLKTSKETENDIFVGRQIEFFKWGRRWSIAVYQRPPVSQENRRTVEKILESFRFDGVPAGDPIWAVGEARKHLPADADPDQFTREGGSSVYYVSTRQDGKDLVVTFTKHLEGQPQKTWSFRVNESGEIRTLPGEVSIEAHESQRADAQREAIATALLFVRTNHLNTSRVEMSAPQAERISLEGEEVWRISWPSKLPPGATAIKGGGLVVIVGHSGRIRLGASQ